MRGGLPHSEIPGSPIARISPGLFAACHVLHRLSVPRHPPDALLLRLIAFHAARAQGQDPVPANLSPRKRGAGTEPPAQAGAHKRKRPRMKTLLRTGARACRAAYPPRSHDKLSLHPSNNMGAAATPQRDPFSSARTPVVEVNGFEPMTSCLQSRRSPN